MGFSLKKFFEDLFDIFNDTSLDAQQKLISIEDYCNSQKDYAELCGLLK